MAKSCDLIANKKTMAGCNVSHSMRHTKRKFYPNIQSVSLPSDLLGVNISFQVAVSSLRTLNNKYGNLDTFLLNFRAGKLGDKALSIRRKLQKKLEKQSATAGN